MQNTKTGLPFASGSLQLRAGSLWAIYRDEHGKVIQRNLRTTDREEGLRLLAELAIPAAVARLRALEAVAYGEASARKLGKAIRSHADGRNPRRGPRPAIEAGRSGAGGVSTYGRSAAGAGGAR